LPHTTRKIAPPTRIQTTDLESSRTSNPNNRSSPPSTASSPPPCSLQKQSLPPSSPLPSGQPLTPQPPDLSQFPLDLLVHLHPRGHGLHKPPSRHRPFPPVWHLPFANIPMPALPTDRGRKIMHHRTFGPQPSRHKRGRHHWHSPHGNPFKPRPFLNEETDLFSMGRQHFEVHNTYYIY